MPKAAEKVKVSVTEDSKGEERLYTIVVKAEASQFYLSDAFMARGLVRKLRDTLGEAAKKATEEYIEAADRYLTSTKAVDQEPSAQTAGQGL